MERTWVGAQSAPYGNTRKSTLYGPQELRAFNLISRCLDAGFGVERTGETLRTPARFWAPETIALGEAVARLVKCALLDDAKQLAWEVVVEASKILGCECVLLYLQPETWPGRLRLAAGCVHLGGTGQFQPVKPSSSYATWLTQGMQPQVRQEQQGTPRQRRSELKIHNVQNRFIGEFTGFPEPKHLPSKTYFSWLCLPLKSGRKESVFGYLIAENRLGPALAPNRSYCFEGSIEEMGKILSNFLSYLLELVPVAMSQRRLAQQTLRLRPMRDYLKEVVRIAILLTGGFRGELAVYEEGRGMVIKAAKGPDSIAFRRASDAAVTGDADVVSEAILPNQSAARYVHETGKPLIIDDVRRSDIYHKCSENTLSQITVPVVLPFSNRSWGTLTVESDRVRGFDSFDQTNLEQLAARTGSFADSVEKNSAVTELLKRFYQKPDIPSGYTGSLWGILQHVYQETGFTSGIIYVADYQSAVLRIEGMRHCRDVNPAEISWRFEDKALATKVFLEQRPYFAKDPANDVFVNRRGTDAFGLHGPILGVPIVFQRFVVGVLVVWSEGELKPAESDVERLRPLVELLVTSAQARLKALDLTSTQAALQSIQAQIRTGATLKTVFRKILEAARISFDRARLLRYHAESTSKKGPYFECIYSIGDERPDKYRDKRVYRKESPYIDHILRTPAANADVHVYDSSEFGPDPYAAQWDRPADQPWAMTFIFHGGELWGFLAVDNVNSRRPLDGARVDGTLAMYGALAELALADKRRNQQGHNEGS